MGEARELTCVAPNRPGRLIWYRDGAFALTRDLEMMKLRSRYSVSMEPIDEGQLAGLRLAQAAESPAGQEELAAAEQGRQRRPEPAGIKYTLHIKNVSLEDTDFHCLLDADAEQLHSRQAHVHVLVPPTRLEIRQLQVSGQQPPPQQEIVAPTGQTNEQVSCVRSRAFAVAKLNLRAIANHHRMKY